MYVYFRKRKELPTQVLLNKKNTNVNSLVKFLKYYNKLKK